MSFDPYHKWFGIRPQDHPPDHYRLLGIDRFEDDPDVIDSGADQRMTHLRGFQTGRHARESQQLLNAVSAARVCLLDPEEKAAYDTSLREAMISAEIPSPLAEVDTLEASQPFVQQPAMGSFQPAIAIKQPPKQKQPPWLLPAAIGGGALVILIVALIATSLFNRPNDEGVANQDTTENKRREVPPNLGQPNRVNTETHSGKSPLDIEANGNGGEKPAIETVDLLSRIELTRDVIAGQWRLENGRLISPPNSKDARVQLAHDVPDEYVLTIEVERKSGSPLMVGLVLGDHRARLEIDSWNPSGMGIGNIDGKLPNKNETWHEERLLGPPGQINLIVCTVLHNQIKVICNNRELINWTGDPARLSDWVQVPDPTRLYVYCLDAEYHFSRIELAPVSR